MIDDPEDPLGVFVGLRNAAPWCLLFWTIAGFAIGIWIWST